MRLIMILVAILLIVGGFGGMIWSVVSPLTSLSLPSVPSAANLCNEGETLVEETNGVSSYTPGQGYGQSARLYCEDADHNRREVTGDYAEGVMGQVQNIFSMDFFKGGFNPTYIFMIVGGFVLLILSAFVGRRGGGTVTVLGGQSYPSGTMTVNMGNHDVVTTPEIQRILQQAGLQQGKAAPGAAGSGDLTNRLRQLDEARKAGLISQEEYDRLRQQILDKMQ